MRPVVFALLGFLASGFARGAEPDVLAQLRPGHPRLLLTDQQLAAAVTAARTDPLRDKLHAGIIELAESMLREPPIEHVLLGPRLLDKSRTCVARVLTCAMAFRLTGEARFAARAKQELLAASAFADWNPSHFLDVAEMSFGVALGYDWLYAQLSPAERATIRRALLDKSLVFAAGAYGPGAPTDKRLWFAKADNNWNQVCNGGLLAAALALADEEPDLARLVVNGARRSLPRAMAAYQPDGGYPEGPNYWSYGTGYNVLALAMLESALGSDFGLGGEPAFDRTALYRLYVQSPTGLAFNYADGEARIGLDAQYTWLARRYHLDAALLNSRHLLAGLLAMGGRAKRDANLLALHAVWFPTEVDPGMARSMPLDVHFRGRADIALFRSEWGDPRALFVGFKGGRNDVNHAHLDLGSFVLDADGVRWAEDLGPDNYNLPDYFGAGRWGYYRLNNHSHNVITPGDALQDTKAVAPIVAFGSTPARAFAVADLSQVYPGAAKKILRGVALLDRSRVLVQDDIDGLAPGTALTWRMLTSAEVSVGAEGHATLRRDGRMLEAVILAPQGAKFSAKPATPPTRGENPNKGVTELAINLPAAAAPTRIAVLLTPNGDHWPWQTKPPMLSEVSSW